MTESEINSRQAAKVAYKSLVEEHGFIKGTIQYYKMILGFGEYKPSAPEE
jgi:hypothetical protein